MAVLMIGMGNTEAFFARCSEAFETISRMQNPLIVHHYDCDGITSGSIAATWFEAQKKPYRMLTVRKIDDEVVKSAAQEKQLIFIDLGSGSPALCEFKGEAVIIDHHQLAHQSHLQANPHQFGFDGGRELSAAGCAYFVFNTAIDLGVVGAVGDIQYPFTSLNRLMLGRAVEERAVAVSTDIHLFGRNSRPLLQLLAYADDPYLPGLTGHEDACLSFLESLSIPLKEGNSWRTYSDLLPSEKKKLVSALAKLLAIRTSSEAASRLTGEVYTLLNRPPKTELSDASEFSTLLNACGRNGRPQLGVDVCLGKTGAYEQARALLSEHRKNLREGISFALAHSQDCGKFILIDGRGAIPDAIIGVVAGMLFAGARKKPVLALSYEESGKIKLSTRGTHKLVEQGLNLGKILSEVCPLVGGAGGGHNIAAGASIPPENLDLFIREFSKRL